MDGTSFDALSRRTSLAALGGASLATLLQSDMASAKKKKKKKGDVNQFCKKQVGPCLSSDLLNCGGEPECLAVLEQCCPQLGTCNVIGFFNRILASV